MARASSITQNDVRAIQLAKAALYAGVRLLMDHLEIDDRRRGAPGRRVRQPDRPAPRDGPRASCPTATSPRVRAAGNAAGTGALIALLSGAARREIEAVVRRVEKIETAVEPRFQEHFVEAMAIPHRTAPSPNLERVVTLPARPVTADRGGDARAERRRRRGRRAPPPAPSRRPATTTGDDR